MNNGIGSAGVGPALQSQQTVVIFRPSDGHIVHMHHVVVFAGGKGVGRFDAEREAIDHARRLGHPVETLETLHVTGPLPPTTGAHGVDSTRKAIVATERSRPARK